MREIITKIYKFDELSEDAKEKAREWFRLGNDSYQEWEQISEDAQTIGLKILELDLHRANKGEFITSAKECAEKIMKEHGETCETYQTAKNFLAEYLMLKTDDDGYFVDEDQAEKIEREFLYDLLEDYRIILDKEIEFQNSDEQVDELIRINEYEFTKDGKPA